MNQLKAKKIFYSLLLPLATGSLAALLVNKFSSFKTYRYEPIFMPPSWLFIAVWTLLYILMGICNYLANYRFNPADDEDASSENNNEANSKYYLSLAVNFLYSIVFFICKWPLVGSLLCIALTLINISVSLSYRKLNRTAALLNIPYILWTAFASVLSITLWMLNM